MLKTEEIRDLFNAPIEKVLVDKIKVGDYVKFIDYARMCDCLGQVKKIEKGNMPGAPVKLHLEEAVLDHQYIMVKPVLSKDEEINETYNVVRRVVLKKDESKEDTKKVESK